MGWMPTSQEPRAAQEELAEDVGWELEQQSLQLLPAQGHLSLKGGINECPGCTSAFSLLFKACVPAAEPPEAGVQAPVQLLEQLNYLQWNPAPAKETKLNRSKVQVPGNVIFLINGQMTCAVLQSKVQFGR